MSQCRLHSQFTRFKRENGSVAARRCSSCNIQEGVRREGPSHNKISGLSLHSCLMVTLLKSSTASQHSQPLLADPNLSVIHPKDFFRSHQSSITKRYLIRHFSHCCSKIKGTHSSHLVDNNPRTTQGQFRDNIETILGQL